MNYGIQEANFESDRLKIQFRHDDKI